MFRNYVIKHNLRVCTYNKNSVNLQQFWMFWKKKAYKIPFDFKGHKRKF